MDKATLLEKTRIINKLIQRAAGNPVDFEEMAKVLQLAVLANCYIVGRRGKILGYSFMDHFACGTMEEIVLRSERFPESYNEGLMKVTETVTNTCQVGNGCVFNCNEPCHFTNKLTTVVPVLGGGERVGTLVLAKYDEEFKEDDLVLAEYGATVVGMEILRVKAERAEEEARAPRLHHRRRARSGPGQGARPGRRRGDPRAHGGRDGRPGQRQGLR